MKKGFDVVVDPITGFCIRVGNINCRNQYESTAEELHERLVEIQREHRGEL